MSSPSITERAHALVKAETAARIAAEQIAQAAAASAAAERDRLEREARIIAAAERQQALLRAERLEAEQAAAAAAAAEQTALAAEVARLRARTPLEVLQDEMAEMKRQMASRPTAPQQQLRMDGELDMRFKSSREEVAALREELAALRASAASDPLRDALAEIKELKEIIVETALRVAPVRGYQGFNNGEHLDAVKIHLNSLSNNRQIGAQTFCQTFRILVLSKLRPDVPIEMI